MGGAPDGVCLTPAMDCATFPSANLGPWHSSSHAAPLGARKVDGGGGPGSSLLSSAPSVMLGGRPRPLRMEGGPTRAIFARQMRDIPTGSLSPRRAEVFSCP